MKRRVVSEHRLQEIPVLTCLAWYRVRYSGRTCFVPTNASVFDLSHLGADVNDGNSRSPRSLPSGFRTFFNDFPVPPLGL